MLVRRTLNLLTKTFSTSKFSYLLQTNDNESLEQAAAMLCSIQAEEKQLKAKIQKYKHQLNLFKSNNNNQKIKDLTDIIHEQQNQNILVLQRSRKQIESAEKYSITRMAKEVIQVMDNIKKCVEEFQKIEQRESEDLKSAQQIMVQVLQKFGIQQFDPTGSKYDPQTAQSLTQIEDSTKQAGTVASTQQTGYMIHDRLLRPAKVVIYKN